MTQTNAYVLLATLLAGLASLSVSTAWGAPGENPVPGFSPEEVAAARKNPLYDELRKAKAIAVAKVESLTSAYSNVAASTAIKNYTLTLTVQTVFRGSVEQKIVHMWAEGEPAIIRPGPPKAPPFKSGDNCLVWLSSQGCATHVVPLTDDLLRVAKIALAESDKAAATSPAPALKDSTKAKADAFQQIKDTGTVVGGGKWGVWGIVGDNGPNYDGPIPKELRKNGLRVRFEATLLKKDATSFGMWRKVVKFDKIEAIESNEKPNK